MTRFAWVPGQMVYTAFMSRHSRALQILIAVSLSVTTLSDAQSKKKGCKEPPKMLSQPRFSDDERAKWKGKSISGKVAIVISEDGDVSQAKVVSVNPNEAAEVLLNAVKRAKFDPRPGCGEIRTDVSFSLGR